MAEIADRKLYLGPRLRVLRRELGLNQTRMAEELGVSPSYLNHLERNQRPLTAQMLLRIATTYDLDMRSFVSGANEAAASDLHEIFADNLVRDIGIPRHEVLEVAENYPAVSEAIARLYRALGDLRRMPDRIAKEGQAPLTASPLDWLRDFLTQRNNHFSELDTAAEALSLSLGNDATALREGMLARLKEAGVTVRVVPAEVLAGTLRHYDLHRRRLMLSERLPAESRGFAIAYQLASQMLADEIVAIVDRAAPPDDETKALLRVALLNHAAAAIVMPYARFAETAMASRHDMDLLCARFQVSYEQAAQRLTTLGRQGARGLPFFFLRIDAAGNVAKRFAGEGIPMARFGGGCPRWGIQRAFRLPGETITALVEAPGDASYFTFARAIPRTAAPGLVTIVLGCEAKAMESIAYADGAGEAAIPIGPACHLCERIECPERALPPVTRALDLDPHQRGIAPYPFRPA